MASPKAEALLGYMKTTRLGEAIKKVVELKKIRLRDRLTDELLP